MVLQYVKAVHIIFVVTWFAGLFYLPRLMVYAAEANQLNDESAKNVLLQQFRLMQKRLLFGITWPSAIITLGLGARLLMIYPLTGWLKIKLVFVALLYLFNITLHIIFRQQNRGYFKYSSQQLRLWNEVPTVILVAVVFLVVLKNTTNWWLGLIGLMILIALLLTGIRVYKLWRKGNVK